jgi:cellulose synthase/poly-beta-1,6-N-acetylglucosamine synthase-like glycosyltransferase
MLTLSVITFLIWLVLFFAWGNFWRIWEFDSDHAQFPAPTKWPRAAAIIPARNEAASIAAVVAALAKQDYPGEFSAIIVDDHSEDTTAELALQAASKSQTRFPIRVISAPELQTGWTGKLSAINAGVSFFSSTATLVYPEGGRACPEERRGCAAVVTPPSPVPKIESVTPDFFWFTDADILHSSETLRRLITRAENNHLDLTSLMVLLKADSFAERLLIPPFLYFFLMLYPPRWIANRAESTAGAAGGCILLRRTALERIGGLSAIRSEIIDDCALARAVKQSGGNIWMGLTRASKSLRSYETFAEIRDMIARTAFTQLHYSILLLLGTLAGMMLTFVLPVALTFSPNLRVWPFALAAWCLMTASFLPTVTFYRLRPVWAPLLPLAALFYTYATVLSAIRHWLGRGGQWKGRSQAKRV